MIKALDVFRQVEHTGGCHTAVEVRILLYALAKLIGAERIVETGYDAGYTTEALALTGAEVIGIDNLTEYGYIDDVARARLNGYDNVKLINEDALNWLERQDNNTIDLIFIDDGHNPCHVEREAHEVRRVLRPGGIVAFHDTHAIEGIRAVVDRRFDGWQRLDLPAISPDNGRDYGISVLRKPGSSQKAIKK